MAIEEYSAPGGYEDKRTLEMVGGGSAGQAIGGAAAIVLAIIGLAHVYQFITLSIATIAVGVALLFEGAAAAAEYRHAMPGGALERRAEAGGMSAEFFGGAAGIVLGILGLVGVAPYTLNAVAAIVFGGAVMIGAAIPTEVAAVSRQTELARIGRATSRAAGGTQVLVGLGAVTLGILALVGVHPGAVLTLIAVLGLGFSVMLSGSAVSAKVMSVFQS